MVLKVAFSAALLHAHSFSSTITTTVPPQAGETLWHPHHTAFSSSVSTSTAFHRATALSPSPRGPLSLRHAADDYSCGDVRPIPRRRRRHRRTQEAGDETRPENSESVPVLLWALPLEISDGPWYSSALFLQTVVTWRLEGTPPHAYNATTRRLDKARSDF